MQFAVICLAQGASQLMAETVCNDSKTFTERCMQEMASYTTRNSEGINNHGFSVFVSKLTHGRIHEAFDSLPLPLIASFNANSCTQERDCVGEHARIHATTQSDQFRMCAMLEASLAQSGDLGWPTDDWCDSH